MVEATESTGLVIPLDVDLAVDANAPDGTVFSFPVPLDASTCILQTTLDSGQWNNAILELVGSQDGVTWLTTTAGGLVYNGANIPDNTIAVRVTVSGIRFLGIRILQAEGTASNLTGRFRFTEFGPFDLAIGVLAQVRPADTLANVLFAVPPHAQALIQKIHAANTQNQNTFLTLYLDADQAGTAPFDENNTILWEFPVPANTTQVVEIDTVLYEGMRLAIQVGTADKITATLFGGLARA